MSTPAHVLQARKLNKARYLVEDFDDATISLRRMAILFGILCVYLIVSMLQGGSNLGHLLYSMASIIALVLMLPQLELLRRETLLGLTIGYLGVLIIEFIALGLPDLLIPILGLEQTERLPMSRVGAVAGIAVFLNYLTPFLYFAAKAGVFFAIGRVWWLRGQLLAAPEGDLRKVLGEERMRALGEG